VLQVGQLVTDVRSQSTMLRVMLSLALAFCGLGLGLVCCGPGLDLEACGIVNITGSQQLSITCRHAAVQPQ